MPKDVTNLKKVRDFIFDQFNDKLSQQELKDISTRDFNWLKRTEQTLNELLPRLPSLASFLVTAAPRNLNSSLQVFEQIKNGETHLVKILKSDPTISKWYNDLIEQAERAKYLIGNLESQQVSAEIQRLIISPDGLGDLVRTNGGSIYPDLILLNHDYTKLPKQNRSNPIEGPTLRGTNPSNVPDGCEIKTNQGTKIRVDAHGAHSGLHLGVTWDFIDKKVAITGVWIGYIKKADHRESGRNVKVTTVKYSFGHDLFISLLDS